MKILRFILLIGAAMVPAVMAGAAGLPLETTVTQATKFEIMRNGQVVGSVSLPKGVELEVMGLDGANVQVRYRSLTGRVSAAHTGLAELAAAIPAGPVGPAALPPSGPAPTAATPAVTAAPAAEAPSVMARRLQGRLVRLQGSSLQTLEAERLGGVKFFALYYSAAWCGPCRQFTPKLVEAYARLRAEYPEFEVVFVSADRSAKDMQKYLRADKMAWPTLRYDEIKQSAEIVRYAGDGIPCLVLVDAAGRVLSDTYRGGNYVGPQAVLDDTRRILQQHRQRNPRPAT